MRKYIDILNEALSGIDEDSLIDKSATPAEYEDSDAEHYQARRKTGFFGEQASGCILMAKSTGRIMIVLRSAQVDQPHTWGNLGGAIHKDPKTGTRLSPLENAHKEAHEETGYTGSIQMIPMFVFQKDTFKYYNYLGIVPDEFTPHLGWEADKAVWCDFGKWPTPLHFGLTGLFNDAKSAAAIKHYSQMFKNGDHTVESVEEDLNLPAGVDVGKAIGAAADVAKEVAADAEAEAIAAAAPGKPGAVPAKPGQPAKPGAPAAPTAPVAAPTGGKKSLAPITSQ